MAANEAKIVITADDKASGSIDGIAGKARQLRGAFLAVGAAGAAVTGAFGLSVKTFAQTGDEIQKMALRTGLTTESLSELKFALEQSGSSIEGFEKGIRRMASFIQDGRDGLTETTRALDSLGIAITDFDGMSPEQSFDLLANALAGVEDNLVQSALAQDIFGRAGTSLIPLLEQGADGIEALREEAEALGIVFDQDAANAAARLVDAQNTLSKSFQGVQIAIAEGLAPALSSLFEKAAVVISAFSSWARENPLLTKVIIGFTGALGGLALAIGAIGLALPIVATGLGAVSVGFIGLNVATGGLIIAIGAIGAGLVLLVTEWDAVVAAFKKGVNFLIGLAEKYANTWILVLNKIIDGINALGSVFGVEIERIAEIEIPRLTESIEEAADVIEQSNDAVIDSNEMLGDSYGVLRETVQTETDTIGAIIKAQNDAQLEDAMRFAENLVANSEARYEALRKQRWKDVDDEVKAKAAILTADEEFEKIRRSVMGLPPVIDSNINQGRPALTQQSADIFNQMGANAMVIDGRMVTRSVTGQLNYVLPRNRSADFKQGSPEFDKLMLETLQLNARERGVTTIVVEGDVYGFEDFADKVEQAQTQNRDAGAIR